MQKTVKMKTTLEDLDSIPDQYLQAVAHYIYGLKNLSETEDLTKPHLRSSVVQIYPLFVFLYTLLIFFGVVFNILMVFHIFKNKLHRDPTYAYLINIAISDVIKCVFVLPFTLVVLLLQNWIFGKFLCYFLPIMQDVPFHVSMMTYLLIAGDRYRVLSDPGKPRIPAFVCSLGSWFFAVCIALPHPIYTVHIDLSDFQNDFDGLGICITNLVDNIQQYMRGLFLLTYIAPLTTTAYFYVKASRELQNKEEPPPVVIFGVRPKLTYSRQGSTASNDLTLFHGGKRTGDSLANTATVGLSGFSNTYELYDVELNIRKEKRTQKYLIFMVSVFAISLCPLMILKLAKLAVVETYENAGHFDITYTLFVLLGFSSAITTPVLYASWQMSRPTKERLKGYFQYSSRRLTYAYEGGVGKPKRQHGHSGLANVAYTPHPKTGSISGSNGGEGSSRDNISLHSADLDSSAQIFC